MERKRGIKAEGTIFAAIVPYHLTPGGRGRTALVQVDSDGKYVKFLGDVKSEQTGPHMPYRYIKPLNGGHTETLWREVADASFKIRVPLLHAITYEKPLFTPPRMKTRFELHRLSEGQLEVMNLSYGKGNHMKTRLEIPRPSEVKLEVQPLSEGQHEITNPPHGKGI